MATGGDHRWDTGARHVGPHSSANGCGHARAKESLDKSATLREMSNRHELVELDLHPITGTWMALCSCGWRSYYILDAHTGAKNFLKHLATDAEDRYTWGDMESEWEAGYDAGNDRGYGVGYDEGWDLGREKLVEELNELKEASGE